MNFEPSRPSWSALNRLKGFTMFENSPSFAFLHECEEVLSDTDNIMLSVNRFDATQIYLTTIILGEIL